MIKTTENVLRNKEGLPAGAPADLSLDDESYFELLASSSSTFLSAAIDL